MAFEIKRKAELSLVALLTEALPNFNFYPSKGGDDDGGNTLPRPPFGAIWIENAEKTVQQSTPAGNRIYLLTGSVVWITRAQANTEGDVFDHSEAVQQIYNAMLAIGHGTDVDRKLIIHGIDVATVNEFSDAERLAHGDVIGFTMGASEFD
jgi:hypothetical protein